LKKSKKERKTAKEILKYSEIEELFNSGKIQADKKNLVLWTITINNGKQGEEAEIKWCNETLKALETIKDL